VLHYASRTRNRPRVPTIAAAKAAEKIGPWSARRDEELVLEYAETGDRLAFEELVRRFEREIYRYLRTYLGDAQLAEDAFQATFLQLHLKCHQFEPDRRLRPWLYTIATNQATDLLRRNRRHKAVSLSTTAGYIGWNDERQSLGDLLEATDLDPSARLESAEECQETRLAVENIPAKLRQLIELVVYQGLKYREAADTLGIPLGTVKSRMNKALHSLHKAMMAHRYAASNGS
jgi:RNA polymerase sigma-70 factor, ECF subfamily